MVRTQQISNSNYLVVDLVRQMFIKMPNFCGQFVYRNYWYKKEIFTIRAT